VILLLTFLTAFFIVFLSTPSLLKVAELKNLYDEPDEERKKHNKNIPSLAGILIFAGTLFSFAFWYPENANIGLLKYVTTGMLLLFFVGVKDDIVGTAAVKKLIAHIIVGLILVLIADIKITSLYGFFGIREIPYEAQILLSLFTYIVVVNAFNLIDGVDGLAGGVGIIAALFFTMWFYMVGDMTLAILSIALAGSLFAFLIFNFAPAKIFMGDSGSLTLGLIFSVLVIKLIEIPSAQIPYELLGISKPTLALALLAYPLLDTLRVFIYRILHGDSPFKADRNHIHHRLLDIGLSPAKAVIYIYLYQILVISSAILTKGLYPTHTLLIVGIIAIALIQVPFFFPKVKNILSVSKDANKKKAA